MSNHWKNMLFVLPFNTELHVNFLDQPVYLGTVLGISQQKTKAYWVMSSWLGALMPAIDWPGQFFVYKSQKPCAGTIEAWLDERQIVQPEEHSCTRFNALRISANNLKELADVLIKFLPYVTHTTKNSSLHFTQTIVQSDSVMVWGVGSVECKRQVWLLLAWWPVQC